MASTEIVPSVVIDRGADESPPVVVAVPQSPVVNILVRAGRTFLQTWVGLLLAALGTGVITAPDFAQLLLKTGSIALAPAVISIMQNAIELLSRLDVANPGVRG